MCVCGGLFVCFVLFLADFGVGLKFASENQQDGCGEKEKSGCEINVRKTVLMMENETPKIPSHFPLSTIHYLLVLLFP